MVNKIFSFSLTKIFLVFLIGSVLVKTPLVEAASSERKRLPSPLLSPSQRKKRRISPLVVLPLLNRPSQVCFLPQSRIALSTKKGEILIYNMKKSFLEFKKKFSSFPIPTLSFYPENQELIFGDKGGVIKVLDLKRKIIVETIYEPGRIISKMKLSPDRSVLAVGDFSGKITFYSTKNFRQLTGITFFPSRRVTSLSFSKDDELLGITFRNRKVEILIIGSKRANSILLPSSATTSDWHKDDFFALGETNGRLSIYQRDDLLKVKNRSFFEWNHNDWVTSVKFFQDFLVTGCKDGKIRVFDFKNKRLITKLDIGYPILDIAIEDNKRLLGVATPHKLFVYEIEKIISP
ncbi:MAG: hypothetical protein B6D56_07380 [Candidatus Omnitrophica bacterium 4484_70.1]|nr:MAG: hypothetical protein B6D56_07380 [Candidatus Omnitrophica bacterium 4484_70.1]